MKPIHKFNNGQGATLCHKCNCIISLGHTNDLYCKECKQETLEEASKRAVKSGLFKDETLFIAGAKWQQEQFKNK
jgi:hypothetical protein